MGVRRWTWACGLFLLGSLVGCSRTPERPPGTGAKEAVQVYYEALLHKDWPKAYSTLHANSRSRLSADQFSRLAENYRNSLGFEPEAVHIRAWDERSAEADCPRRLDRSNDDKGASVQRCDHPATERRWLAYHPPPQLRANYRALKGWDWRVREFLLFMLG